MLVRSIMSNFVALNNFRAAKGLYIPSSWIEDNASRGRLSSAQLFHPPDNESVTIMAFSRGYDLGDRAAELLRKILSQPAHVLDDLEKQRISDVLAEQIVRKRFKIDLARTEAFNGKVVLITDGTHAASGDRALTIFADVYDDGHYVEEFQYSAPGSAFPLHLTEAMTIFKSIPWASAS